MKYGYLLLLLFSSAHGVSWWQSKTQTCSNTEELKRITCTLNTRKKTLTLKEGKKTTTLTYDPKTELTTLESTGATKSVCSESGLATLLNPKPQDLTIKTIKAINDSDEDSERLSQLLPTLEYVSLVAAAVSREHPDDSLPHAFLKKYYRSSGRSKNTTNPPVPPKYTPAENLPIYKE